MPGEFLLGQCFGRDRPAAKEVPSRVDDLGPAAIVEGDAELEAAKRAGDVLDSLELPEDLGWKSGLLAEGPKPDVVVDKQLFFLAEVLDEEPPEGQNLGLGPPPVFLGKSIKRQERKPQPNARFDGFPDGFRPGPVPRGAGQAALLRPTAVAVHDDGDVTWKFFIINGFCQPRLFASGGEEAFQALEHGGIIAYNPRSETPNMCLAVPSKVVEIDEAFKTGRVDHLGAKIKVNLALLDDIKIGDWVIVHAGFAISKLDEADAEETLGLLREMAESGS